MGKSKDTPFDMATDTPTTDSSSEQERGFLGHQPVEEEWKKDLATVQTPKGPQELPTLGEPRVPDEGEVIWSEFLRINKARGQLNLDAKSNQRENLIIILKLKRHYGPGWSYCLSGAVRPIRARRSGIHVLSPISLLLVLS